MSEDTDFQGAEAEIDLEAHPGVLACDTSAKPGEIAASVRRIEMFTGDLTGTVLFVPGEWLRL